MMRLRGQVEWTSGADGAPVLLPAVEAFIPPTFKYRQPLQPIEPAPELVVQKYVNNRAAGTLKPAVIATKLGVPITALTATLNRAHGKGQIKYWSYHRVRNRLH